MKQQFKDFERKKSELRIGYESSGGGFMTDAGSIRPTPPARIAQRIRMSDLQQRESEQQNIENSNSDIQTRIHGGGGPVDGSDAENNAMRNQQDLDSSDTQKQ